MTDHHEDDPLRRLGLEPADLDGHTIEELGDYLDADELRGTLRSRSLRGASSPSTPWRDCGVSAPR